MEPPEQAYPVQFAVDYPDRELNRLTTAFRIIVVIPILVVLGSVDGGWAAGGWGHHGREVAVGAGGLLFFAPLLMIVFRQKYPRWWFDWNRELLRFINRVGVYVALMDDRYPATDEQQSVTLELPYPNVERDLNRWLPLVKWFLAIPHYIALIGLWIVAIVLIVVAWFVILFTGRYPRSVFDYLVGVGRWENRVVAYAFLMVTDRYPPFRLGP